MKSEFILVIVKHRSFGWMLKPYLIEKLNQEFYTITESVLAEDIDSQNYTPEQREIIKWAAQCSDLEITKLFSRKKMPSRDFIAKLTDEKVLASIREYIEKRLHKCFEILQKTDISVYHKSESKNLFEEDRIEIVKGPTKTVFNFIKETEGSKYFLSISDGINEIKLSETPGEIITNAPCVLMAGQRLYFFSKDDDGIDGKKLLPFFTKDSILIPKSAERKYFETFVKKAVENYDVKATGFRIDSSEIEPDVILSLENDWKNEFTILLKFNYSGRIVSTNSKKKAFVEFTEKDGTFFFNKIARNFDFERKKKEFLNQFNDLEEINESSFKIKKQLADELNLLNWINQNSMLLSDNEFIIKQNFHDKKYYTNELSLDFNLKETNDWFDLKGTVSFGEFEIPFIALKNHLLKDIREYVLPNGEIAILPDEWFVKYSGLFKLSKIEDGSVKINKHHLNYFKDELAEINKSLVEKVSGIVQLQPEKPEGLLADFRPYQQTGFRWIYSLYSSKFGSCLADDMGLGKTIQTLASILKIQESTSVNQQNNSQLQLFSQVEKEQKLVDSTKMPAGLIVMPTSLIHNWINEISKFAPKLKYYEYTGSQRIKSTTEFNDFHLVLTSYGVLRNDIEILSPYFYHFIILDESQFIKNPGSKTYQAIMEIKARFKMVLTGTPIENSLIDLWAQLNFINPGLLGSQEFFRKEFAEPIEKNKDEEERKTKQQRLQKLISPFILRRTKKE
ncbi:MAG: SNF2-related protein, partial [Bacteroidales bacterium]|nr:SNF2-related protein [Bacteroidales bacterium]